MSMKLTKANNDERELAKWCLIQVYRNNTNGGLLTPNKMAYLNKLPYWSWNTADYAQ